MRETLVLSFFLAVFVGGYYYTRQHSSHVDTTTIQAETPVVVLQHKPITDGGSNVKRSRIQQNQSFKNSRKDEGVPSDSSQDQSLTSIYQTKAKSKRRIKKQSAAQLGSASEFALGHSSKSPEQRESPESNHDERPVIPGVPEDWISLQNNLLLPYTADAQREALRVFVQCHELKSKGLEYVGEQSCEKLFSTTPRLSERSNLR